MNKRDRDLNNLLIANFEAGYAKGFYEGRYTKRKKVWGENTMQIRNESCIFCQKKRQVYELKFRAVSTWCCQECFSSIFLMGLKLGQKELEV